MTVVERIREYLAAGGLFNPEMADHEVVRDLLIDAASEIEQLQREMDGLIDEDVERRI